MAHREEASKVPVLVSPREQAVVAGERVTFVWKPVDNAASYHVEIARTQAFDDIVYRSEALQRTEATVEGQIPVDDDTYYWRVIAQEADGTTHGRDNIESFVSATQIEAAAGIPQPDQEEELGPVERMMRGAVAEAAAEISDAPRWVDEESDLGVEHEGLEAGQILGFVLATAVALALAVFVLFQYFDLTAQEVRQEATSRSGYPELRENRLHAAEMLTQYGSIEGVDGRYRIPIDRAMQLMANDEPDGEALSTELEVGRQD